MTLGCSPLPQPRLIERSEANDQGAYLGAAIRDANASGIYTDVREGFDAATVTRMKGYLRNMLGMDFNDLTNYYRKNKWIMQDIAATNKAKAAGMPDAVYKGTKNIDEIGVAAAVTKTYLESVGAGVKQMADNFIRKVNAGENATLEGMQFAQQMQGLSRFGGYVLGWDQGYGRAMRTQMLRSDGFAKTTDRALDQITDKLGNAGKYEDKFQEIAMKLQDPLTSADGVNELINLAKRVQFLENPTQIISVSSKMHIAGNAWEEVFKNGMLSDPNTFMANASGAAWVAMRPMLQLGTAKAYAMTGLPGAIQAEQAAAEAGAALAAMHSGFMDAVRLGWRAFRTETNLYQAGAENKIEFGISGARVQELAANMGKEEPPDALVDTFNILGKWIRLPNRALTGVDEFAKHLAVRGEVAAQAIKRATLNGVDLSDAKALQAYMEEEGRQAFHMHSPELWEKYKLKSSYSKSNEVMREADQSTFQESNRVASTVTDVLGKMPFLKPFVPFVRTPLNILNQGFVESTGVGAIMNVAGDIAGAGFNPTAAKMIIAKRLLDDPGETFRITGQIALMSTVAATFYGAAMSGAIVGGGPGRWSQGGRSSDAQKAWERMMNEQGRSPYSILLPDGSSLPFSRLPEPVAGFMRMFADMGMNSAWVNHESKEEWLTAMTVIGVSGLYQASFLRGVNDIIDLMGDPYATTMGTKGSKAVQSWMATQTPFGGFLSFVDRQVDPFKHAYQGATFGELMKVHEDTFGTGIFAKIADRLPGFNGTPTMIDQISGLPVPMTPGQGPSGLNPFQAAIPFLPRGYKGADGAWAAIYNILGSYRESKPTKYKLTNAEQQELNKRMATTVINGRTVQQAVLEYYDRPDVQEFVKKRGAAFTDVRAGIKDGLTSLINEYYLAAEQSLAESNGSVMKRAAIAGGIKDYERRNDFETAHQMRSELDSLFEEARVRGVF